MIEAMSRAARAIVESLDGERAKMLMQPFDAAHVRDWHYVPRERRGLPLERASESQRARMWALVELGVSGEGVRKAHEITQLEGILGRIENRPDFRRPLNYALAIFGVPDTATPWGWRFEGHHLSLTFILDPASGLITTPVFFGANRQTVPRGHGHDGWRVLPAEEDMGFALINALDEKSRSEAIIADRSPGDIITGPGRERELKQPRGLAFAAMPDAERNRAIALLDLYLNNIESTQAAIERRRIEDAGLDEVHLAWAGSLSPGREHYYRLHGPTFVVEYENSQNDATHCHSVWHNPASQMRIDPLKDHLEHDHGHA
ncbi:MAG: DUF3500 domain-containing protein [Geminicoccaceae bacterium]|nr:DUF3500 domain-containing protein [Geminicoccaceae bacterium]